MNDTRALAKRPIAELIEAMIDKEGLGGVLDHIASICFEKGEHINASYSDEPLALTWFKAAEDLNKFVAKLPRHLQDY